MTSSADALFKVELQGAGDNPGAWHTPLNNALTQIVEGVASQTVLSVASADVTLTDTQYVSNQARQAGFKFTGVLAATRTVTCPDRKKVYYLWDTTTHAGFSLTFKPSGGTGITLVTGHTYIVACDGAGGVKILAQSNPPYAVATGTDTYAVTLEQSVTLYAGFSLHVLFTNANTTAATLAINGGSAIALKKSGTTALVLGDIPAGTVCELVYDGTNYQVTPSKIVSTLALTDGGTQATGFTAAVNTRYNCVFGAAGTITLPASAAAQDTIILALAGDYIYTLAPNGLKINTSTNSLLMPGNQTVLLTYTGATNGWV